MIISKYKSTTSRETNLSKKSLLSIIKDKQYLLKFDGVNDYLEHETISLTNCTWSATFKIDNVQNFNSILGSNLNSNYMLSIFQGKIYINYSGNFYETPPVLISGQKYTITVTRNINEHKIYINGILVYTTNLIGGLSIFKLVGTTTSGGFLGFIDGVIYNVKLYDSVLTDEQVNNIYLGFNIANNKILDLNPIYPTNITTLNPTNPFLAVTGQSVSIFGKTNPMDLNIDFEKL